MVYYNYKEGEMMFVEERQATIIDILQEHGKVRVKELSERFQVSEDLIRKDLTVLEEKGLLKKAYGGAVLQRENIHRKLAAQRKHVNTSEKEIIAKIAVSLIHEGDVIFLDISTVNIELVKELIRVQKHVTIVTNMLEVVVLLAKTDISVVFIGGEFDYGRDGFVGSLAIEMLRNFRFDISFMGVVGVDVHENSVSTYMANDGVTKKEILACSKRAYMMCEYDKLSQAGNYCYAGIDDFTGILIDKEPDKEIMKSLRKYGVKVLCEIVL